MKSERQFQSVFRNWLKARYHQTGAFELKVAKTSLSFSAVQPHQLEALRMAKHGALAYKIPDDTIGYRPFDCFCLAGVPAFVVVAFPKYFYLIDVDDFIREQGASARASLTETRAKEIAIVADGYSASGAGKLTLKI